MGCIGLIKIEHKAIHKYKSSKHGAIEVWITIVELNYNSL